MSLGHVRHLGHLPHPPRRIHRLREKRRQPVGKRLANHLRDLRFERRVEQRNGLIQMRAHFNSVA